MAQAVFNCGCSCSKYTSRSGRSARVSPLSAFAKCAGTTCGTAPDAVRPATQERLALSVSCPQLAGAKALYPPSTRRRTGPVSYSASPLLLPPRRQRSPFPVPHRLLAHVWCCRGGGLLRLAFTSFCLISTTCRPVSDFPPARGRYCPIATGKLYCRERQISLSRIGGRTRGARGVTLFVASTIW